MSDTRDGGCAGTVYLDNNATTRVAPEVLEAMLPFFGERYGNPSSMYRLGGSVKRLIERAREQVAALIGAEADEIVFTSCGSESDNMALKGFFLEHRNHTRIITSAVEHSAVRNTARYLHGEGAFVCELPVDADGMISFEGFGGEPVGAVAPVGGGTGASDAKVRTPEGGGGNAARVADGSRAPSVVNCGTACAKAAADCERRRALLDEGERAEGGKAFDARVMDSLGAQFIDPHTIVSLMWANNETGVIFPIDLIAGRVKELGGTFHTDAVQAAGKIRINVKETPVDMLAISGHKLHAPKGIGAAFIRRGVKLPPYLHGGHQEYGRRAGTENVPYIIGFGKACEMALANMEAENTKVRAMRDRLENALLEKCPGARLNGHPTDRLPNTVNISFENIEGEAILLLLDEAGIAASSGSACTTGSLEPSHVMMAMGIPYNFAHGSIRFSLSVYNIEEDIDRVIEVMPGIVEKLRALSPFV